MTELGYGNNAVKMETTSTYDEKTQEFVVNCPTVLSQKYWITNGACHAHYCAVFAQLIIDGKKEGVHGFLVQFPVPDHISQQNVIDAIDPSKDADGLHPLNAGRLASGLPAMVPATPEGCLIMAKKACGDLTGKHAVIIGRSNLVGKPVAQLLLRENCTVTIAHSRSRDLPAIAREADILVAAVGRPKMIKRDWVKKGAVVIDVGINRVPAPEKGEGKTRLVGDVDFDDVSKVAGAITPVPGGVGLMTVACLLRNTVIAACRSKNIELPKDF